VGSNTTGGIDVYLFESCVLSGRGLCYKLINRPEESYRLWCVVVCDLENLRNEEAMKRVGLQCHKKKVFVINYCVIIKIISTLMHMMWHIDKYKITFKLVINHWTNEIL
jgi:hypothetical protein